MISANQNPEQITRYLVLGGDIASLDIDGKSYVVQTY